MIGKLLGNRYEILERIGGGGMAIVYRALDTILNRYVSVKVLRPQFVSDPEFVHRFRREAQSAASLSHPNVVNIYDVGVEDETYYIVMEYINGKTLKEVIQERAPLPTAEAVEIAKQICAALQHAHEHHIVHRDIKPHNILMGKDGHVKVTDFGIARAISSNTITHNGSVLGSVHYFSPEQARGGITDVKSDIYSLGVVLYEMMTGELPFSGESPISVALKHLQEQFVDPRQLNPKIPQSVENIILKSLAKNPDVRYQSATEMSSDLNQALQNPNPPKFTIPEDFSQTHPTLQIPAAALNEPLKRGIASKMVDEDTGDDDTPAKKRNIWKIVGIVVGILLLGGVGVATGFTIMSNFMSAPTIDMPKVQGMTYDEAVQTLKQYGFKEKNIQKALEEDAGAPGRPPLPADRVFEQDPESGKQVKTSRTVTLKVSKGAKTILMPDLNGLSEPDARQKLASLNLDLSAIKFTNKPDSKVEKGKVSGQNPGSQVQIIPGQTNIEVFISSGPESGKIPDLKGLSLTDAFKQIQDSGFQIGTVVNEYNFNVPNGQVIRQGPQNPGQDAPKNSKIDLWVSKGSSPDVQKRTYEVSINPENGSTLRITIKKSDVKGQGQVFVQDEQVSSPKKYSVDIYVTPSLPGKIEVYENGVLKETKTVTYMQQ